jgi:hypothetical protein
MGRKRNFCRVVIAFGMLALGVAPGHPVRFQVSRAEVQSLQAAARPARAVRRLEGDTLAVLTPMMDPHGQQIATALVDLPAAYLRAEMLRKLQLAVAVAVIVLLLRGDELGRLAGVFLPMARAVQGREPRWKQQVPALRIEVDTARRERQVAEITGTDYFQELQRRAADLRSRTAASHPSCETPAASGSNAGDPFRPVRGQTGSPAR